MKRSRLPDSVSRAGTRLLEKLGRLWNEKLRFHRGKLIGAALGLLIGLRLFGLLFGLIAGQLVDTIFRHYSLERDLNRFDGSGSLGFTAHGRVAAATLCALSTAAQAKRLHENYPEGRSGDAEEGDAEEGSEAGGSEVERKDLKGGAENPRGLRLDGSEIELVKRQVIRGFALSAEGRHVVEAVQPAHRNERNFEQLLVSDLVFPEPPEQYALMQCLYEAASLFGPVSADTRALVERVRAAFAVPPEIEQMAYLVYAKRDIESYRLLGIDPEAPIKEIKRVYRSLAVQFHPDSLSALEPEQQKTAEEAFLKIRRAYESIMRERQRRQERPERPENRRES